MGKVSREKRDVYYRKAKEEGWRARSAFKLLQVDEVFDIFSGVHNAVDLCAAPGSWSQVLSRKLCLPALRAGATQPPRLVSVDLQPLAPIEGITHVQGDITTPATAAAVISHFEGAEADLVICDGAPDVTGIHDLDEYVQAQLLLAALTITTAVLAEGGTFVAKVFKGRDTTQLLYAQLRSLFADVAVTKPRSSRDSSLEAFVVCRGFTRPAGFTPQALQQSQGGAWSGGVAGMQRLLPYMACGDLSGWDGEGGDGCAEGGAPAASGAAASMLAEARAGQQLGTQ